MPYTHCAWCGARVLYAPGQVLSDRTCPNERCRHNPFLSRDCCDCAACATVMRVSPETAALEPVSEDDRYQE